VILVVIVELLVVAFMGVIAWVVVVEPLARPFSKTLQDKNAAFEADMALKAANHRRYMKANYYWDSKTRGYRVRRYPENGG